MHACNPAFWRIHRFKDSPGYKATSFQKKKPTNNLPFYNFVCIFLVYFLVEDDPHFIIYLPKSQKNICFNIDSEPGKILSLVSDPDSGNIKADYIWINYLHHGLCFLLTTWDSFLLQLIRYFTVLKVL